MKVLQVIHGYPMRFNAGSEVYTQTLCQALAERHEVHVFTRMEDDFAADHAMRVEPDADDARVTLHLVNMARTRDRYRYEGVDQRFAELLDRLRPDVVHIGHLNHLSTSLVREAAGRGIPQVFTLHDYWLMCPRGQFMQMHPENPEDLWAACDGQEHRKCALRCYARYASGAPAERAVDVAHWTNWVARRMAHVREMVELIDLFVAPSRYLMKRFRDDFGLPERKLHFLDYGFDLERLRGRQRQGHEAFTFGYIGTHIPAKGIQHLLAAFAQLQGQPKLRVWGRPRDCTPALRDQAHGLPGSASDRIEWMGEYRNIDIVPDVLNRVDAIVVPSIWAENSPLVIHEALQARVPVITADAGGMAEHVEHEANGLLFRFRDPSSMAEQMQRLVDDPGLAVRLGARGYRYSNDGEVPALQQHVEEIEGLYRQVIAQRDSARVKHGTGPWRITFDTNPDTCNLHCIMCEEHSLHSPRQAERRAAGKPPRMMPFELLQRILTEAARNGLREVIPSTMGEPLMYPDFDGIIDLCRELGLKLNLTTNGTFPRHGARTWAERIVPIGSDVKISWNGATAETQEQIMLGGRWEKVLGNVRNFIAVRDAHAAGGGNRCRVTFQLTFLQSNVAELADIVRLASSLGVDRVKGHHLWAHFAQIADLSMRRSLAARREWNEAVLAARTAADECRELTGRPVLLENIFLLDEQTAGDDLAPGGQCPFLGQEAWVSAEGRFDPCCAPDAHRRTLGDFGNLHHANLDDIWNGDDYRQLVSTYRTRTLCLGCNMRRPAQTS
ncbi:MAG: glycosyltransferase [Vicinamibacterales bacterium]